MSNQKSKYVDKFWDTPRKVPPCTACAALKLNGLKGKCAECTDMNNMYAMGHVKEAQLNIPVSDKCRHCDHSFEDHSSKGNRCPITNKHPRSWGLTTYERKTYQCQKCGTELINHGRQRICGKCGHKVDVEDHLIYVVL